MKYPYITLAGYPDIIGKRDDFPHIPTWGHIASAFDLYRTVAIHSVKNKPNSWCFTDTETAGALGRIIDGPIKSFKDIEKAESALRAILLHDYIEILIPCVKTANGEFTSYLRFDKEERNQAAIAAFNAAPCRDFLLATKCVNISKGQIVGSSNAKSPIVGLPTEGEAKIFKEISAQISETASTLPLSVEASTYYNNKNFISPLASGDACFIDSLYRRIYKPWMEIAQSGPSLFIETKLPPFLAIVLSRANNRTDLPDVITALREELEPIRCDLNRMNALLDGTMSQADLQKQVQNINESFDAIVAESLLTASERRSRRILSVFNSVKPVRQLYSITAYPLTFDLNKFKETFNSISEAVRKNSRIISRCNTATKFAELLRTDSVRETILTHFTEFEVNLLKFKK